MGGGKEDKLEATQMEVEVTQGEEQNQETAIVKKSKKDTKWKKGQSGNPSGRPKKEYSLKTLVDKMMEEKASGNMTKAEQLLHTLYEIAITKKDTTAINILLERWAGKAKAFVEIDNNISFTVSESAWGDDALEADVEDVAELEEGDDEEDSVEIQTPEDSS